MLTERLPEGEHNQQYALSPALNSKINHMMHAFKGCSYTGIPKLDSRLNFISYLQLAMNFLSPSSESEAVCLPKAESLTPSMEVLKGHDCITGLTYWRVVMS